MDQPVNRLWTLFNLKCPDLVFVPIALLVSGLWELGDYVT